MACQRNVAELIKDIYVAPAQKGETRPRTARSTDEPQGWLVREGGWIPTQRKKKNKTYVFELCSE